jgi:hypothetical protein
MRESTARDNVYSGIRELMTRDRSLLIRDASERAISHRLALYLEEKFPNHNVDCEYNRDGRAPKMLRTIERIIQPRRRCLNLRSTIAVTVYPDIIVHQRETNAENLLVIEVKKSSNRLGPRFDCAKLRGFREEYGYRLCCSVRFTVGDDPDVVIEWSAASDGKLGVYDRHGHEMPSVKAMCE